jgi:hypothetical protein
MNVDIKEDEEFNAEDDMRNDFALAIEAIEAKGDDEPDGSPSLPKKEDNIFDRDARDTEEPVTKKTDNALENKPDNALEKSNEDLKAPKDGADSAKDNTQQPLNVPVGWKAGAREAWAKVPPEAQRAVLDREREVSVLMQQTADERRTASQFASTLEPYRQQLQQQGYKDPFTAVNEIVGTAVRMQTGTMEQRAQATYEVIKSFGIDINALDNAIVNGGQLPAGSEAPNRQMEEMLNKRLAPIDALMQQRTQQNENTQHVNQQQARQDVATFSETAEFISDVRTTMADLMQLAAKDGRVLTMPQAYETACKLNPEVSKVIQQRENAQRVNGRNQELENKQVAASSVTGVPAGGGDMTKLNTLEDALNAAWDMHH